VALLRRFQKIRKIRKLLLDTEHDKAETILVEVKDDIANDGDFKKEAK
jgi:predicted NAD-dependent protein-ADP-ribosyltransferase YbiA (DUF1768 family)